MSSLRPPIVITCLLLLTTCLCEAGSSSRRTNPVSKNAIPNANPLPAKRSAPKLIETDKMEPDNVPAYSGQSVRLYCEFAASPPATVTWFKNGRPFHRGNEYVWYILPDYLYLENLTPGDEGNYTCVANNSMGRASHSYYLMIENPMPYPPHIDTGILHSRHDIAEGDNVTLECRFESVAAARFNWSRFNETTETWVVIQDELLCPNDTRLCAPNYYDYHSLNLSDFSPADYHFLNISDFSPADEGRYMCAANNVYGFFSHEVTLKILTMKEPQANIMTPPPSRLTTDIAIAAGVVVGLIVIVYTSFKMQKYKKNRITVVHAEQSFIIRRVVLEHDVTGKCLSPRVKIETEAVNLNQLGAAEKKRALNEYQLPLDKDWEVARDKLIFGEKLGEGAFGVVFKATARAISGKDDLSADVAVKMLKDPHTDSDLRDLVSEMEVMKKVGRHENIISLLGCVTQDGPPYVIVEFAANGNLKDWLKSNRPTLNGFYDERGDADAGGLHHKNHLSIQKLLDYACQISKGMKYLSSQNCIHRDLAARNVLVTADETMKIADFGLARDLVNRDYYLRSKDEQRLPIRWMAPEALFKLKHKYTSKSDVWSFGVVLWELFSFGMDPYPDMNLLISVQPLIDFLTSGKRMAKPEFCPFEVYSLMKDIWSVEPEMRPTFDQISEKMDEMKIRFPSDEYLDLTLFPAMTEHVIAMPGQTNDRIHFYQNQTRYMNHAAIIDQTTKINPSYFTGARPIPVPCPLPPADYV